MESSSCIFYELQLQNAVNKNQASSCIHYTSTLIFPSCEGMQEGCMQTAYQTSNLHTQLCISRVSVNIQQDSWIAVPPCIIGTISNKSLFLGWKQCINIANTCLLCSQTAKVLNSTSLLNPFHWDALCSTGWSLHSHSSPGVVFSSAVSLKINIKITAFPPKNAHRHCGDESLPQPIEGAMNQSVGSAQGWNLRCQELLKVIFSTRESLMFYLTTN